MAKTFKSEDRIQQECFMWFNNNYPSFRGCLFHVPNGGARSAQEGKKFKLIGVWPGVADLLFMHQGKTYCFELKNELGRQSTAQKKWQKQITNQGFDYYIIRSKFDFIVIIEDIIKRYGNT